MQQYVEVSFQVYYNQKKTGQAMGRSLENGRYWTNRYENTRM